MKTTLALLLLLALPAIAAPEPNVRVYEGTLDIPTYAPSARETQPPPFGNSTVTGVYPFTTYVAPRKKGTKPRTCGWRSFYAKYMLRRAYQEGPKP